jgi:hypothetical protein
VGVASFLPPPEAVVGEGVASTCREPILVDPRCTAAQVWAKARGAGAPPDAVAQLIYLPPADPPPSDPDAPVAGVWSFTIEGSSFSVGIPDDCSP